MNFNRYFASIFIALFIFTFISFNGCGDDTVNTITNPQETPLISGTITNYPGGSTIVKAKLTGALPSDSFFVGTDTVDNTAMLSMDLTSPPANYLDTIGVSSLPPGITVSDTSARIAQFNFLRVYGFSNDLIGNLQKRNYPDSAVTGSILISFIYSSKAFTISGTDTNAGLTDTTIITYNSSFSAGWNAYTLKVLEKRTHYTRLEVVNGEVSGASWYYNGITPTDLMKEKFGLFY